MSIEAIRLADELSRAWQPTAQQAAIELRRLHEEVQSLRQAIAEAETLQGATIVTTGVGIGKQAEEAYEAAKKHGWVGLSDERLMEMPEFTKHTVETTDDWSEWVCPDPESYLMKCCDCGLVHEAQFGVVRYKSETEREDCDMVDDRNLQAVFRMRRHEAWEPKDTAHRAGGLPMEQAQPVSCLVVEGLSMKTSGTTLEKNKPPTALRRTEMTQQKQEPVGFDMGQYCCGYAQIKDGEYKLFSMRTTPVMADGQLHPIYAMTDEHAEIVHSMLTSPPTQQSCSQRQSRSDVQPLTNKYLQRVIYEHTKLNPNRRDDQELIGYIINAIDVVLSETLSIEQAQKQCQCPACKIKPHASDCPVHNEPAWPNGPCDCGAIEQAQQETLAWMYEQARFGPTDLRGQQWMLTLSRLKPWDGDGLVRNVQALCTSPPPRQPLSDKEKLMCWSRATYDADVEHKTEHQCLMDYGSEIEAAHGIKGVA